jgi:hypothetical protein
MLGEEYKSRSLSYDESKLKGNKLAVFSALF